jgi:hypothetical protein
MAQELVVRSYRITPKPSQWPAPKDEPMKLYYLLNKIKTGCKAHPEDSISMPILRLVQEFERQNRLTSTDN